jgi:hypothetical protein
MVMAGIKKIKTHGVTKNNPSKEENPMSNTLVSPGKTQRNKPVIKRKTAITTYPINELRKLLSSFNNNDFILFHFY